MNGFSSLPEVVAFDALRFIYETGAVPPPPPTTHAVAEDKAPSDDADVAAPSSSRPESRLPGLRRLVKLQMRHDAELLDSAVNEKHRRHRTTNNTGIVPILTHRGDVADPDGSCSQGGLAAAAHVSAELVYHVLERTVYAPEKASQRYMDAMMHFVLNSPLAPSVAPKLCAESSSESGRGCGSSDESDLSQRPRSPRAISSPSFPTESSTYWGPGTSDRDRSIKTKLRKERHMLFTRYETCCEVLGTMPLSSVLDRLADLDDRAASAAGYGASGPTSTTITTGGGFDVFSAGTCSPVASAAAQAGGARLGPCEADNADSVINSWRYPRDVTTTSSSGAPGSPASSTERTRILCSASPPVVAGEARNDMSQDATTTPNTVSAVKDRGGSSQAGTGSPPAEHGAPVQADESRPLCSFCPQTGLHAVCLSGCEGLGRPECLIPLFGLLEGFPKATFLGLAGIDLTDAGACVLALLCEAHLPHLRGLDLSNNPLVTDLSAAQLHRLARRHSALVTMKLDGTSISKVAAASILARTHENEGKAPPTNPDSEVDA